MRFADVLYVPIKQGSEVTLRVAGSHILGHHVF